MEPSYFFTIIVTLAALILYFWILFQVGKARMKYGVEAPRLDGPEAFQRVYRAQANTSEQMVLFIPLLWVTAYVVGDVYAAALGGIWALGRLMYVIGYYAAAPKRFTGFVVNMACYTLMLLGCLYKLALPLV